MLSSILYRQFALNFVDNTKLLRRILRGRLVCGWKAEMHSNRKPQKTEEKFYSFMSLRIKVCRRFAFSNSKFWFCLEKLQNWKFLIIWLKGHLGMHKPQYVDYNKQTLSSNMKSLPRAELQIKFSIRAVSVPAGLACAGQICMLCLD